MAPNTSKPSAAYQEEDRKRLRADRRRLQILYEDNPVDADVLISPRDLAFDYPLAAAKRFSTFCTEHLATTPATTAKAQSAPKPTLVIIGPRRDFECYQEAFRFVFDFYCHGAANLDVIGTTASSQRTMMAIADNLGIQVLKDALLRDVTSLEGLQSTKEGV